MGFEILMHRHMSANHYSATAHSVELVRGRCHELLAMEWRAGHQMGNESMQQLNIDVKIDTLLADCQLLHLPVSPDLSYRHRMVLVG